jgi:predicted AlkP superfamily phosphohydrolase/phosphomutase
MSRSPRIVIIGIDASDAALVERWAGEGKLPFLASLMGRGVYSRLASTQNLFGDAPWPSLNAGVSPAKHAFYNHLQLRRGTTEIERVSAHHCRHLPFWAALRGTGRRVVTLDVPKTFPMPGIDGVQISAWAEHYPLLHAPTSEPPQAVRDLIARFGECPHPAEVPRRLPFRHEIGICETLSATITRQTAAAEHFMKSTDWELFFTVFSSVHYAAHQFFHDYEPSHWAHDPNAPAELTTALPRLYAETDRAVERLLASAPPDATVFVLSVHGIEPNFSGNHLMPEVVRRLGFEVATARGAETNVVGSLVRATRPLREAIPPRLRDWINARLLPESFHDRAYTSAFSSGTDWSRTRAFFLPSDHFQALISVNLKGREPGGIVDPRDYDATCREIAAEMTKLTNAATGRAAVSGVVCIRDVYDGPNVHELPDVVVQWAHDAPIEGLSHPRIGSVTMPGFDLRRSQHASEGWIIASGAAIDPSARLVDAATVDFAPTILHLLDEPIPRSMDGRVWLELLDARGTGGREPRHTDDASLAVARVGG